VPASQSEGPSSIPRQTLSELWAKRRIAQWLFVPNECWFFSSNHHFANHSGCTFYGINCIRPLKHQGHILFEERTFLFCVCVALRAGSGVAMDWSSIKGVLQTVYRNKNVKKLQWPNKGLYSLITIVIITSPKLHTHLLPATSSVWRSFNQYVPSTRWFFVL
jgi:hypothetical protein